MDKFTPANHGFISLQHDIIRQTVFELVPRAIDYVRSRGYRLVSMGECVMGDSKGCWQ